MCVFMCTVFITIYKIVIHLRSTGGRPRVYQICYRGLGELNQMSTQLFHKSYIFLFTGVLKFTSALWNSIMLIL
jgi:hypothetical protein